MENGNIRAAIGFLCCGDTPASSSVDNLARLQEKCQEESPLNGLNLFGQWRRHDAKNAMANSGDHTGQNGILYNMIDIMLRE